MRAKSLFILAVLLLPASVFAQASLTGTVRDASGGVLPGVTVEASSPALIEKVRTAVTDDSGQYRIIDLRAGTYTLSFSLPGFSPVRRENVTLAGSQTLTIPVEMRVGAIQETVTVTGETPVVDVQSARREVVIDRDMVQSIPASRAAGALLNATPGLTVDNNGIALSPTMTFFSANGGANNEGRMAVNGMTVGAARSGGVSSYVYDAVGVEEVAIRVGGGLGETDTGGPIMNIVPRSGGNTFSGTAFTSIAGDWSRGNNLTPELMAPPIGLTETPGIIQAHDASFSLGGPDREGPTLVLRAVPQSRHADRGRRDHGECQRRKRVALGLDVEPGECTPGAGPHDGDGTVCRAGGPQPLQRQLRVSEALRGHAVDPRCPGVPQPRRGLGRPRYHDTIAGGDWHRGARVFRVAVPPHADAVDDAVEQQVVARCQYDVLPLQPGIRVPAARRHHEPDSGHGTVDRARVHQCESGVATSWLHGGKRATLRWAPAANYVYRALEQWGYAEGATNSYNVGSSYVTGAHNIRVGYQQYWLRQLDETIAQENQLAYRFNQGVPNRVTYRLPTRSNNTITQLHGIFAQDQYTRGRLTLSGALRWDRASSYAPVEGNGVSETSFLNPAPITFEKTPGVDAYNDISPRAGIGYDVFGNGKTAVKLRWGKYLGFASNDPPFTSTNKGATLVATVNRNWTDNDGDKVVDCDLLNNAAQGPATGQVDTCAVVIGNDANFGRPGAATQVDPKLLEGWGVRTHDYQTEVTLQQEILPRVSAEVGYIHRTFHGFFVTNDINRNPQTDWVSYTLTVPNDPRLPGGGGYPVTTFVANTTTAAQNFLTPESTYGEGGKERDSFYDGVNVNVNARMRNGLFVSIGTQTGRRVDDRCHVVTHYNNAVAGTPAGPNPRNCRDIDPWETTVRGLGSYTIPKIDVLVSATVRSQAPLTIDAQWQVPNTMIQNQLGFLPPSLIATGNSMIDLTDSDHRLFGEGRRTQVDMRFAKVFRFGRTRTDVGVDLWNLLNTNYATSYEDTFTVGSDTFYTPDAIYPPRFVRLNFTVNF
jgi:hypothetical protein